MTIDRTSFEVPWLPPVDAQSCRFINEIVLAEESDGDSQVGFARRQSVR